MPDKYQAEVLFAAVNGTVSFNKTYVTLYDKQGNYAEDGTGRLTQKSDCNGYSEQWAITL